MREPSQVGSEAEKVLRNLEGRSCALVDVSYGGELVIGFGSKVPTKPPLSGESAEWMLFTGESSWYVRGPQGVVASDRDRMDERFVARVRESLLEKVVSGVQLQDAAFSLTIRLSEDSEIVLLSRA